MQLALDIDIQEHQTLSNFCWHGNEVLQSQLALSLKNEGEHFFYIWGNNGVGKSHLLQALTQHIGSSAIYLSMEQLKDYGSEIFEGIDQLDFICIDNVDAIAGNYEMEEALFHLYNRIRDNNHSHLIIADQKNLSNLSIQLPDLHSRIAWGLVFQMHELNEEDKLKVIEQQAHAKGFNLPENVGHYLIKHCARSMHQLTSIIGTLDKASLAAKRKLTVPFVKQILNL